MNMTGHHALLFAVVGGVVVVGALLALILGKKKKTVVEELTAEDMQRIDSRLVTGDVARTESRFRRRYGVDANAKNYAKPPEPKPEEAGKEKPTP